MPRRRLGWPASPGPGVLGGLTDPPGRLADLCGIGNCWRMRFDRWTLVIGAAAIALTVVLGALAGALAGVLTALAGAAFAVGWQIATGHQSRIQAGADRLREDEERLALPRATTGSPAG